MFITCKGLPCPVARHVGGEPEVRDLDRPALAQQYVVRLDICYTEKFIHFDFRTKISHDNSYFNNNKRINVAFTNSFMNLNFFLHALP